MSLVKPVQRKARQFPGIKYSFRTYKAENTPLQ